MARDSLKHKYAQCVAIQKRMNKYVAEPESSNDKWFDLQQVLKEKLLEMLYENFLLLPKRALANFLSMCSSHRPVEPHQILTRVAIRYEELYK
jgi:hypothetical protein